MVDRTDPIQAGGVEPRKTIVQPPHGTIFIYEWREGVGGDHVDFVTRENVRSICEIERVHVTPLEFRKEFGWLGPNTLEVTFPNHSTGAYNFPYDPPECFLNQPQMFSQNFYGLNHSYECPLLKESEFLKQKAAFEDPANFQQNAFFFDKGYNPVAGEGRKYTAKSRANLLLGGPLNGYNSIKDRETKQRAKYINFAANIEKKYLEMFGVEHKAFESAYAEKWNRRNVQLRVGTFTIVIIIFLFVVNTFRD